MYYRRYEDPKEVTKGEIIVIVIAFIAWTLLCVIFNNIITNRTLKSNEKYYKAIQIDSDERMFEYAMRTDAGKALVHGNVTAVDTVKIPELNGEYMGIRVEVEKYTQHSKTVDKKDKNGKVIGTKKEYYETWDPYDSEYYISEKVRFLNVEFPYSKFDLKKFDRVDLDEVVSKEYESRVEWDNYMYEEGHIFDCIGDLRYSYSVIPLEQEVTILADLNDKNIDNVKVHYETILEVMEGLERSKKVPNIIFTIVWYIVFAGGAYFFAMQRNRWADVN